MKELASTSALLSFYVDRRGACEDPPPFRSRTRARARSVVPSSSSSEAQHEPLFFRVPSSLCVLSLSLLCEREESLDVTRASFEEKAQVRNVLLRARRKKKGRRNSKDVEELVVSSDLPKMSLVYAQRLTRREDFGGRLGDEEILEAREDLFKKSELLARWWSEAKRVTVFTGCVRVLSFRLFRARARQRERRIDETFIPRLTYESHQSWNLHGVRHT